MNSTPTSEYLQEQGARLLADHSRKDLMRFITCGSVDDGKSTLIGRLLLDTGAVYEDQIEGLRKESQKHGTIGQQLDPALLLDGLEDERQQGITIDVAYRYFATANRKFIIADTPGHEQFTRNMATGASTADVAVILVDASKGVLTQTRRHAFLVSLLGIKQVVVAVNKMDLIQYDESIFRKISEDFRSFASRLEIPTIHLVPLSARDGDNVTSTSSNMPWYDNGTLLELLEQLPMSTDSADAPLRFPVQWVNRPDPTFRGFSGTIASGALKVGDQILTLPSNRTSRIRQIVTRNGELSQAAAPHSVTVTLSDEIDLSRGDMIVSASQRPQVGREADAMLIWMSENPLTPGKSYWIKHTTRRTSGEISQVRHIVDVNTLERLPASSMKLNEIGYCRISLRDPIMFDSYRINRQTGSFIVVDRITHETVAAGLLVDSETDASSRQHWDDEPTGMRLERAVSLVTEQERQVRYGQKPFTLLITGLSGSGKTTLAMELERRLFDAGKTCVVLDGQTMRLGISRDLGFSAEERSENLRRAAEIARSLNDSGLICVAAFVAPHDDIRQRACELIGADRVVHVHLATPLEVCQQRDQTGRYRAADRGEISSFPGVTFPYATPDSADRVLSMEDLSSADAADTILEQVAARFGKPAS